MGSNRSRLWGEGLSQEEKAEASGGGWTGTQVAAAVLLLLLIFAVFIHSSGNTASIERNAARIAALEAEAGNRPQADAGAAAAAATASEVKRLKQRIASLERQIGSLDRAASQRKGIAVPVSVPGRGFGMLAPQRLQPPPGNAAERLLAPDQGSSDWSQTLPEGDLPRYQRSISPDGKLILRKLQ